MPRTEVSNKRRFAKIEERGSSEIKHLGNFKKGGVDPVTHVFKLMGKSLKNFSS